MSVNRQAETAMKWISDLRRRLSLPWSLPNGGIQISFSGGWEEASHMGRLYGELVRITQEKMPTYT